jgi:hypothetical protein
MNDDIERTLHRSLDRHAAQLGGQPGAIDAVYDRVRRRRQRRRAVAGVGSFAIAAAGVIGIATVGRGSETEAPAAGAGDGAAWACTGFIGGAGDTTYYSDCYQVDDVPVTTACVTTTTIVAVTWVDSLPPPEEITPNGCVPEASYLMPTTIVPAPFCSTPPVTAPPTTLPMTTIEMTTTTTHVPTVDCDPNEQTHQVQAGDSVYAIASMYGVDPQVLANYNSWPEGIEHPILVGDIVKIPPGYPFVSLDTLPELTAPPTTAPG